MRSVWNRQRRNGIRKEYPSHTHLWSEEIQEVGRTTTVRGRSVPKNSSSLMTLKSSPVEIFLRR